MNNLISICIATYKRPVLLEKLLISLFNQKNIDEYNLEIVVVDNDPNRTAEPVIKKIKEKIISNARYSIKYDIQTEKNIALTRNKTVELASGDYLFFIDDDEYADELCIYNHIYTMKKFSSDITVGDVVPYFESPVPDYISEAYPFYKRNGKDGSASKLFITGNTMFHLKNIYKELVYFNPEYGITGGSDNELLQKLNKMGKKIVSCSSSMAFEYIPPERANLKWLLKRVFRTGNNYTRTLIQNYEHITIKIIAGFLQLLKGYIQFLLALIFAISYLFFDKKKSINWLLKSISNLSKPFAVFGMYPKEYK